MKQVSKISKKGFTLVEVTLAMGFLSVLLITITFLTIHITATYQKGLSIKAITSTGRELVDEFSRAIASASGADPDSLCNSFSSDNARTKCQEDNGRSFAYQVRYATPQQLRLENVLKRDTADRVPVSGVFCSGHYSYLWNSGYVLNNAYNTAKDFSAILVNSNTNDRYENFRLLKVADVSRSLCTAHLLGEGDSYTYTNSSASTVGENRTYESSSIGSVEEIITNSEDNLALYSLDIFSPAVHKITRHSFYSGTFILATVQGGIDITSQGNYCSDAATSDLNTDFNYCAINKFNFAMRATGETK